LPVEVIEFAFAFFEARGVDENSAGIDPVLNAVHGAFAFALGGSWPGRFAGITPVGVDLFLTGHVFCRVVSFIKGPGSFSTVIWW